MSEIKVKTFNWKEMPSTNPYLASETNICGYDVYGDLIGNCNLSEFLLLLLKEEKPKSWEIALFNILAVSIANFGPRDPSIRSATCGGVSDSVPTATLISALCGGSGTYLGCAEVAVLSKQLDKLGIDVPAWINFLLDPKKEFERYYTHETKSIPGFFNNVLPAEDTIYIKMLNKLEETSESWALNFLKQNYKQFELYFQSALSPSFVIAATCVDLKIPTNKIEMIIGILKLPGAMYHAAENIKLSLKEYPKYSQEIKLREDIKLETAPTIERFILDE